MEKPIIITFDDGYLSNYEIAYPISKHNISHHICHQISVGKSTYKDTDIPIYPHFSASGGGNVSPLISIAKPVTTYQHAAMRKARKNVLKLEGKERTILSISAPKSRAEIAASEPVYVFFISARQLIPHSTSRESGIK